jgi:hypothetical protein
MASVPVQREQEHLEQRDVVPPPGEDQQRQRDQEPRRDTEEPDVVHAVDLPLAGFEPAAEEPDPTQEPNAERSRRVSSRSRPRAEISIRPLYLDRG